MKRRAVTSTEYAVMLALIIIVVLAALALRQLGENRASTHVTTLGQQAHQVSIGINGCETTPKRGDSNLSATSRPTSQPK